MAGIPLLVEDDIGGKLHLHETPVVTGAEALVYRAELFGPSIQPLGQPVMAIEIDLQAERCPSGHPVVTESKGLIDVVEVVMEAFAGCGFHPA